MVPSATFGQPVAAGGQVVAVGSSSTASTAMSAHTGAIRVVATVACFIEIGDSGSTPTAAANTSLYLGANLPEYFAIKPNAKVAVIRASVDGSLYISQF